jgi:hypothetical protein
MKSNKERYSANMYFRMCFRRYSANIVLIYVDIILVTSTHCSLIFSLITQLQYVFKMKDLGDLNYFLGIQEF